MLITQIRLVFANHSILYLLISNRGPRGRLRARADVKSGRMKKGYFSAEIFAEAKFDPLTILPDPIIERVDFGDQITITLYAASLTASCPLCGTLSKRVQSHYTRTLADLPSTGYCVHFIVYVRRIFRQKRTYARKIFAKQFPSLTRPLAQFSLQLQKALRRLGVVLWGEAGAAWGDN
jgi:hypothetical protein